MITWLFAYIISHAVVISFLVILSIAVSLILHLVLAPLALIIVLILLKTGIIEGTHKNKVDKPEHNDTAADASLHSNEDTTDYSAIIIDDSNSSK